MRITKEMIQEQNNKDKERVDKLMNSAYTRNWIEAEGRMSCQAGSPVANDLCEAYELLKSLLDLGGITKSEYNKYMKKICKVPMTAYHPDRYKSGSDRYVSPEKYYGLAFNKKDNYMDKYIESTEVGEYYLIA